MIPFLGHPVEANIVGSMEAPSKVFLMFFLFSDWLKSNHLRSRIEGDFLDIFSRHICCAVIETIRVTNYATSFGAKNVQKTMFKAAEVILHPWNQQNIEAHIFMCFDQWHSKIFHIVLVLNGSRSLLRIFKSTSLLSSKCIRF